MNINKNKVAIISTSLGIGGAERFASSLSFMIESLNIEVHSIIVNDVVEYEFAGKLFNLGTAACGRIPFFKKIKKGFLLHNYLCDNQINIVIDNRPRNNILRELITNSIYGSRKTIAVVHSFKLENYFPKSVFWSQFLNRKVDKLVCVSNGIEKEVKLSFNFKNTKTIYNFHDFSRIVVEENDDENEEYILYFGRFNEEVKNFSLMLEAFLISKIFLQGIKLFLVGDGPDFCKIENLIKEFKLQDYVVVLPFMTNPFSFVKKAKFTVLTSRYEGFPMSIVESLALGTPVVTVDCESGPNELIIHEFNGLLVENFNCLLLANAFKRMIKDRELYDFCKRNAVKSVQQLSLKTISREWKSILCE